MRDEIGARNLLSMIEVALNVHPNMRLGQILINAVELHTRMSSFGTDRPRDLFYVPDDEIVEALQTYTMPDKWTK